MRNWWVNQNQTFTAETRGGYLWSPKRKANGTRNQFYENMREVSPKDRVFSFRDTYICAIGVASSHCYEAAKPQEFGSAGQNWANLGWKVDVVYRVVDKPIRPKEHIESIRPFLPAKYSPLQDTGDGMQSVYLAEISNELAELLLALLRDQNNPLDLQELAGEALLRPSRRDDDREANDLAIEVQLQELLLDGTEKEQLIKARRGQGRFRENTQQIERCCRVTKVSDSKFLIASHIKPWRSCNNKERLDGENGLLLAPSIDFLFDRGYISFSDNGVLLLSPVVEPSILEKLGVPIGWILRTGSFTVGQRTYLSYHRREVFLQSGSAV